MKQRRRTPLKERLPLATRVLLLLSNRGRRVDGLRIASAGTDEQSELIMPRVEEALRLIKTYDRVRYNRLIRDLERVWVTLLPGHPACYDHSIRACELDTRYVLADTSQPEVIASTIVHEAAHARLRRSGIGYEEDLRPRVEAVCYRAQIAFAAKLPNGEQLRERAWRALELSQKGNLWSDATLSEGQLTGEIEMMRYLGFPDWLARTILTLRAAKLSVRRFVRGLVIWRQS